MGMRHFLIGFALLAGCVTSRSQNDSLNDNACMDKEKKSIAYEIWCTTSYRKEFDEKQSSVQGQGAWVMPQTKEESVVDFKAVFKDYALSILPVNKSKDHDILLSIHMQNSWDSRVVIAAFMHGLSLYCIPCWGDDVYYLKVTAVNKKGLEKEYLIRREVSTTSWLPLIFAMPFSEKPITARNKVMTENWKELLIRMSKDGFFDKDKIN